MQAKRTLRLFCTRRTGEVSKTIAIVQSLDTSLAMEKAAGFFEETRSRYEIFTEFDKVVLLTQDESNFSDRFSGIVHVPCAYSKYEFVRQVLSRFQYIRWLYFFARSLTWLLSHHKQIDLLITDNIDSPAPLIVSMLFRIPYVIFYRYDVGSQVKKINGRIVVGTILIAEERFALKRVQHLWVQSPHLADLVKSLGRKKRTAIIQNWTSVPKLFRQPTCLSKEEPTDPSILFVGRLHKVKQIDLLLNSLRILHDNNTKAHLYILGGGEEYERLTALTRQLRLEEYVHFLGFVNRKTVLEMMQQSDVLVLPSKVEGNPRVLIEGMMCKIPIVATNIAGIRDMVRHKDTGYLIESPDSKELAGAIEYVIRNKRFCSVMTNRAYDFAIRNFSKEVAIQKICEEIAPIRQKRGSTSQ